MSLLMSIFPSKKVLKVFIKKADKIQSKKNKGINVSSAKIFYQYRSQFQPRTEMNTKKLMTNPASTKKDKRLRDYGHTCYGSFSELSRKRCSSANLISS